MSICDRFLSKSPLLGMVSQELVANRSSLFYQFNYKSFNVGFTTDRPSECEQYRHVADLKFSIHWKVAKKLAAMSEQQKKDPRNSTDVYVHVGGITLYYWDLPIDILTGINRNHIRIIGGEYKGFVSDVQRFWNGSQLRISCANHPDFDVNITHRLGERSPYAVGHRVQFTILQGIGARLAGNHCWRKTWSE